LSYGDRKHPRPRRAKSPVRLTSSVPVAPSPEEGFALLPVKPAQELLKAGVGLDLLDRVERVAQFVMRPRLVDEILAGMAGGSDIPFTFAAWHNVVPSRRHLPLTKCANFVHPGDIPPETYPLALLSAAFV